MYSPAKHVLILPHTVSSPGLLEIVYWPAEHEPLVAHTRSLDSVGAVFSYSSVPVHSCTF